MKLLLKESVLRICLLAVNYVFAILSMGLIGLGIVYSEDLLKVKIYFSRDGICQLPSLLILLGILGFAASIAGCCFTRHYSDRYLKLLVAFLTLLLAIELTIACLAFLNLEDASQNHTEKVIKQLVEGGDLKNDFHLLEKDLHCCAVNGLNDYIDAIYIANNGTKCYIHMQQINEDYPPHAPIKGCGIRITEYLVNLCFEIGGITTFCAILEIFYISTILLILMKDD